MVNIPHVEITNADIAQWQELQKQLADLKQKESLMRDRIVRGLFAANLKEGTNNFSLGNGYVLKGTHTITRTVDPAVLTTMWEHLKNQGVPVSALIKNKPELVKSEYSKLPEDLRHQFDQVLTIKPGSTSLKVEFSKAEAKKLGINPDFQPVDVQV